MPVNPLTGLVDSWDEVRKHFGEDVRISEYADISIDYSSDELSLTWKTDLGIVGKCSLPRSRAGDISKLVPLVQEWEEFKEHVSKLEGSRFLFRGQAHPRKLRTSFHRTGRANLIRFLAEDVQVLHKHLSAKTRHVFNLENPNENGAFFNLVQHHGYPTPLLDWTYSPYVAAFFAYRSISGTTAGQASPDDRVRIFIFDQLQWKADWSQVIVLAAATPHLSIGEFLAIENERMIPQQAASTVTNIDDIESYIASMETPQRVYLRAIDLPTKDRDKVMKELRFMGITAGSLFPGLDGACEELRERNFEA